MGENEREVALLFNIRGGGGAPGRPGRTDIGGPAPRSSGEKAPRPGPAGPYWLSKSILSPARCK